VTQISGKPRDALAPYSWYSSANGCMAEPLRAKETEILKHRPVGLVALEGFFDVCS